MARRRPRLTFLLRLAWREGRTTERIFVAYIASSVWLTIVAVAILTILSGVSPGEATWFWFVALGGIITFPAFQGPIFDSAYGLGFLRATLSQDWMRPPDREYYQELLRFRSTRGANGRLRSDLVWAAVYCIAFPGNVLGGVLVVIALYPRVGSSVGFAMTVVAWIGGLVAGVAYSRRTWRTFREAEARGFRLVDLKKATRRPWSA